MESLRPDLAPHHNQEPTMLNLLQRLTHRKNERGASAVEYGLLVAAIAALIVAVVFGLGRLVSGVFSDTCEQISEGSGVAAECVEE